MRILIQKRLELPSLNNISAQGSKEANPHLPPIIPTSILRLGTKTHSSMIECGCNPLVRAIYSTDATTNN